jgi:hypothetical protein
VRAGRRVRIRRSEFEEDETAALLDAYLARVAEREEGAARSADLVGV